MICHMCMSDASNRLSHARIGSFANLRAITVLLLVVHSNENCGSYLMLKGIVIAYRYHAHFNVAKVLYENSFLFNVGKDKLSEV